MRNDGTDLIAEERAATERDAELTTRERALHGRERALEERRRSLAEREMSLRARASELAEKAAAVQVTLHEEVKSAASSRMLEAPLATLAEVDRRTALQVRRRAAEAREEAVDTAELAAVRVDETLREAEAELGHRENSVAALAREVIRRERSELDRREALARQMAADSDARKAEARAQAEAATAAAARATPPPRPAAARQKELEAADTQIGLKNPEDSGANRRIHPRINVELEVSLSSEHNFFAGFTQNVSEGGLFIATHEYAELGTELEIKLRIAGHELRSRGRVAWIREYNVDAQDTSPGMGVEFIGLPQKDVDMINAFLRKREPMFYDA